MEHQHKTLLTIVVLVIVALIILWVVMSVARRDRRGRRRDGRHDRRGDNSESDSEDGGHHRRRFSGDGVPAPVGGVVVKTDQPGEVTISWDPTPNADHYLIYLNTCTDAPGAGRKKVGSCGDHGSACCPVEECDDCVSQSNYEKLVETEGTSICVETCSPCVCFLIVPYNRHGDAGNCTQVRFAFPECFTPCIRGQIKFSNCDGTHITWECPECCDTVNIFVDGTLFESVPCEDGCVTLEQIPECIEIGLQCENACGLGEITIIKQAVRNAHASLLAEAQNFRARRRQKPEPRGRRQAKAAKKVKSRGNKKPVKAGRKFKL